MAPHCPVLLRVHAGARQHTVAQLHRPRKFPGAIGPPAPPPNWEPTQAGLTDAIDLEQLQKAFEVLVRTSEKEWSDMYQVIGGKQFVGRAQGVKVVQKCAIGPKAGPEPRASQVGQGWRYLADRLHEASGPRLGQGKCQAEPPVP